MLALWLIVVAWVLSGGLLVGMLIRDEVAWRRRVRRWRDQ